MNTHSVEVQTVILPTRRPVSPETLDLLSQAKEIAHKAYAPYSKFRVGAALLLENGVVVTGSNQENAAYPSGLCAERVAMFYANAHYPDVAVVQMLIYAETDEGPVKSPITPCAACRQVLLEKETLQGRPIEIVLAGSNDLYFVRAGAAALVPLSFVPSSLQG